MRANREVAVGLVAAAKPLDQSDGLGGERVVERPRRTAPPPMKAGAVVWVVDPRAYAPEFSGIWANTLNK